MTAHGLVARRRSATAVRAVAHEAAADATERFLSRHPDWLERYGERARTRGREDAEYHARFLAAAIEAGSAAVLADYVRWTAAMLGARGIGRGFVVENVRDVAEAAAGRLTADDAQLVHAVVAAALRDAEAEPAPGTAAPPAAAAAAYLEAALAGRRQDALAVAQAALAERDSRLAVYREVVETAMIRVGSLWASRSITVAQEHLATAVSQYVLSSVYVPGSGTRGRAVVCGVEGELHQLGAHIVADALDADGWEVRFLGTNVPEDDMLRAVEAAEPAIVGLSATMPWNLGATAAAAERLASAFGRDGPAVLVGGRAFQAVPGLAAEFDATYAADVEAAVTAGRRSP